MSTENKQYPLSFIPMKDKPESVFVTANTDNGREYLSDTGIVIIEKEKIGVTINDYLKWSKCKELNYSNAVALLNNLNKEIKHAINRNKSNTRDQIHKKSVKLTNIYMSYPDTISCNALLLKYMHTPFKPYVYNNNGKTYAEFQLYVNKQIKLSAKGEAIYKHKIIARNECAKDLMFKLIEYLNSVVK